MQQETTPAPAAAGPTGRELSSPTIAQVAAALAAAQGAFPVIPRDREVTVRTKKTYANGDPITYTFTYAPLATVLEKVRKPLAEQGLALTQAVVPDAKGESVRTMLLHSSGEFIANETPLFVGASDNASQGYASGMTYARRYGITALLCIAADDDDDAGGTEDSEGDRQRATAGRTPQARGGKPQGKPAPTTPRPKANGAPTPLADGPRRLLEAKGKAAGLTPEQVAEEFGEVTMANLNEVLAKLGERANGGGQ